LPTIFGPVPAQAPSNSAITVLAKPIENIFPIRVIDCSHHIMKVAHLRRASVSDINVP
jgi:hypothetical protein